MNPLLKWELDWIDQNIERYGSAERANLVKYNIMKRYIAKEVGMFNYVDIKTKGCEGWLNLFFNDHCVALIDNPHIADEIRNCIEPKYATPCEDCGAVVPVGCENDHQCE